MNKLWSDFTRMCMGLGFILAPFGMYQVLLQLISDSVAGLLSVVFFALIIVGYGVDREITKKEG